jgi:hypothetical protein
MRRTLLPMLDAGQRERLSAEVDHMPDVLGRGRGRGGPPPFGPGGRGRGGQPPPP